MTFDRAADCFDPELFGAVDRDVGDVGAVERERQRRKIAAKIDPLGDRCGHRPASTPGKAEVARDEYADARSLPDAERRGICVACVAVPAPGKDPGNALTIELPIERAARLPPMSIAVCRIDPANRSKKGLLTFARTPPTPTGSVAGDWSAIVTPSGRISRF